MKPATLWLAGTAHLTLIYGWAEQVPAGAGQVSGGTAAPAAEDQTPKPGSG